MIIRNQRGFALAICLALLPCLIAGLLLAFTSLGFVQTDLALKHQCRSEGIHGQKQVAPLLTSLLALNPLAFTLKVEYWVTVAEIAAYLAAQNYPGAEQAQVKLDQISEKRKTLDKQQKQLIKQSNLLLRANHFKTSASLLKTGSQISNILLKVTFIPTPGRPPKLAVHPDSSDIAPTYSLDDDFEVKQSLAHEWQYGIQVRAPFSSFISGNFIFKKACAVTLNKEGSKWIPKITKARFLLKSVW